jgi:ketosteroid isomerase-like protein
MKKSPSDLVRQAFSAYLKKDRAAIEEVIADDFTFTSPYDDHIDRTTYFERCWPNSDKMRELREVKLFEQGDEVFVLYEARFDGSGVVRNTEFFRTAGGKITAVEVYFGSPTK